MRPSTATAGAKHRLEGFAEPFLEELRTRNVCAESARAGARAGLPSSPCCVGFSIVHVGQKSHRGLRAMLRARPLACPRPFAGGASGGRPAGDASSLDRRGRTPTSISVASTPRSSMNRLRPWKRLFWRRRRRGFAHRRLTCSSARRGSLCTSSKARPPSTHRAPRTADANDRLASPYRSAWQVDRGENVADEACRVRTPTPPCTAAGPEGSGRRSSPFPGTTALRVNRSGLAERCSASRGAAPTRFAIHPRWARTEAFLAEQSARPWSFDTMLLIRERSI